MDQHGEPTLWQKVIIEKYALQQGMFPQTLTPLSYFSPIWKQIWLTMGEKPFCDGVSLLLGKGDRIQFWHDIWIIDSPLKDRFPRLFSISLDQPSLVMNMGFWNGIQWEWSLRWSRQLRVWECDLLNTLLGLLNNLHFTLKCGDRLIWKFDSKCVFSIKSASSVVYTTPLLSAPL